MRLTEDMIMPGLVITCPKRKITERVISIAGKRIVTKYSYYGMNEQEEVWRSAGALVSYYAIEGVQLKFTFKYYVEKCKHK